MLESDQCRRCNEVAPGRGIPVLLPGQRTAAFHLCEACRGLLEAGLRRAALDPTIEPSLDGTHARFTEPQVFGLIDLGRRDDGSIPVTLEAHDGRERRRLVRDELRKIDHDVKNAREASVRGDWAAALEAVRMLQGRTVVSRRVLEGILGSYPVVDDLPPLVRAIQAIGHVISDREVDQLAPDELRARMHAVLRALDHELLTFLEPPDEATVPAAQDDDIPSAGVIAPEQP